MSDNFSRPTFGANVNNDNNSNDFNELTERRKDRKEWGAGWSRTSRSGLNYHTIRLRIPIEDVQQLLAKAVDGVVQLDLVSFPNKVDGNTNRPSIRLYPEIRD